MRTAWLGNDRRSAQSIALGSQFVAIYMDNARQRDELLLDRNPDMTGVYARTHFSSCSTHALISWPVVMEAPAVIKTRPGILVANMEG